MNEAILFIGTVIAGVTEAIRYLVPQVNGAVTIAVAALVGLLVALVDVQLGLPNISLALGVSTGLGTAGVVGAFKRIG